MRRVVPVPLKNLEKELGSLYKTFKDIPDTLLWIAEQDWLFIGDVQPHSSLLCIGTLLRAGHKGEDVKKRLPPLIRMFNPKAGESKRTQNVAAFVLPVESAGTCRMDGTEVALSSRAFDLKDPVLTDELKEEITKAAREHFTNYQPPPDSGIHTPKF